MRSASSLFGVSGVSSTECFLCGIVGADVSKSTCIRDGFTNWDSVASKGSQFVCPGCAESMSESADIRLVDGEVRQGQRRRMYSWVLTEADKVAATKAHIQILRQVVMSPPPPPFAIVLSDSGQKHFIWRTPVNGSQKRYIVRLEEDLIEVDPALLLEAFHVVERAIAACGKPALYEASEFTLSQRFIEYYESDEDADRWFAVAKNPITRLAHWLTPGREWCRERHKSANLGRVPTHGRGTAKRSTGARQVADPEPSGDGSQLELYPS